MVERNERVPSVSISISSANCIQYEIGDGASSSSIRTGWSERGTPPKTPVKVVSASDVPDPDPPRSGTNGRSPSSERTFRLRSEEHTSELQSRGHLVCRLLLEKKK